MHLKNKKKNSYKLYLRPFKKVITPLDYLLFTLSEDFTFLIGDLIVPGE
jgi:hypothetical protein